jgi:3-hydroxyacyl-CoA dehydrogenase
MKFITLEDQEAQIIVNALGLLASHLEDRVEANDLTEEESSRLLGDISQANDLADSLKVVL